MPRSKPAVPATRPTPATPCKHLDHPEQPYCLLESQALCPDCASAEIERRLDAGAEPMAVVRAIGFDQCDHGNTQSTCWPCSAAIGAALTISWSRIWHFDETGANRLLRVIHHFAKVHDRKELGTVGEAPEKATKKVRPNPYRDGTHYKKSTLKAETLAGDRARAGAAWTDAREMRKKALRLPPAM